MQIETKYDVGDQVFLLDECSTGPCVYGHTITEIRILEGGTWYRMSRDFHLEENVYPSRKAAQRMIDEDEISEATEVLLRHGVEL